MKNTYKYSILLIATFMAYYANAITINASLDSDLYHFMGSVDSTPNTLGVSYAAYNPSSDHSQSSALLFDYSSIAPGFSSTTHTATLRLYATPFPGGGFASFSTGAGMQVSMLANAWDSSSLALSSFDDGVVMGAPLQVFSDTGWVEYDVTSIVQAQYYGVNNGIGLTALPGSSYQFASSETEYSPQISISVVPEPSTYALLIGFAALLFVALRQRKSV